MSAAGSKVNHSVVFSAVLCCRSLPLFLVFLPSPPPLACSGLWRAVVNRNMQLIAKADISWVGGGKLQIFDEGYLFTHTGAGSESAGRFLTLMMGVSALSPRQLICRSEVNQCSALVKTQQEIMQTWHFNKDLCIRVPPPFPMCPQTSMETVCFHC